MRVDIKGQRFGRLVPISYQQVTTEAGRKIVRWLCQCDCGNTTEVLLSNLKSGNCSSCGCLRKEHTANLNVTHGLSHTPEYRVWTAMISRCYNPNAQASANYGGRGIEVCDRWHNSFEAFYADMGPRPSDDHSIERRDVNGHYEQSNCYWATSDVQSMNRRNTLYVEYLGEKVSVKDLSEKTGVPYSKLYDRIFRLNQTVEKAIGPDKDVEVHEGFGKKLTLRQWAVEFDMNYYTLYDRVKVHGSIEQAMSKPVRRK